MPANLPPHYYEAEKEYRRARTAAEKIEALETMLAIMPKHKGTDHLKADLRAKIAKLLEEGERHAGGTRAQLHVVRKEGAGQVVFAGPPNVGKSRLLAVLTGAAPKVADYPFTTQLPMPAMMPYENVQVQLVDVPPMVAGPTEPWLRNLIRRADLLLLVVDLSQDPLADLALLREQLASFRIELQEPRDEPAVEQDGQTTKRALLVANKADAPDSADALELLQLENAGWLPLYSVSAETGLGLEDLRRAIYEGLRVIRVYTRSPRQEPDLSRPIILPQGSTVEDLARDIHKEIAAKLKFAQVWGSAKFPGQRVGREFVLADGDVVELFS
ncbi:MAG: TGS domain-containing protein [Chloroflexota bacterium]|nr:MAG: TGS domain-containing protein [Chloroflexota bacterium]